MNEKSILSCLRLPARLNVNQTAEALGFLPHEICVLMRGGLLKPLGRPSRNGHKFFCAADILELSQSREWLDRATRTVAKCWHVKNSGAKEERELVA